MDWLSYGAWGAFGLLAGIGLVSWAAPHTGAGVGLLMVICLAVSLVIRGVWKWAVAKPKPEEETEGEE